ncbi:MAG: carbohydrate kinase family protein [Rhizomicrobium sp.]
MMKFEVAVVGEIYIDHVLTGFAKWPEPGEEVFTRQYAREIGGGAVNTACALARLGRSTRLFGVIGAVDAGWIGERLGTFNLSGDTLEKIEGNTGVTVSVSMRDDRSFFTYSGENDKLIPILQSEAMIASLRNAKHVHFALPLPYTVAMSLLPILRAAGCTTSLDVGFQYEWLCSSENRETCRSVDYMFPNEKEASLLSGGDAAGYLSFAQQEGFPNPLVKLGSHGAAMLIGDILYEASSPLVKVVDTTGAGDAFDAGFIDGILDAAAPEVRLNRACICGSLSTRAAGALSALPHRKELERAFEKNYGA